MKSNKNNRNIRIFHVWLKGGGIPSSLSSDEYSKKVCFYWVITWVIPRVWQVGEWENFGQWWGQIFLKNYVTFDNTSAPPIFFYSPQQIFFQNIFFVWNSCVNIILFFKTDFLKILIKEVFISGGIFLGSNFSRRYQISSIKFDPLFKQLLSSSSN